LLRCCAIAGVSLALACSALAQGYSVIKSFRFDQGVPNGGLLRMPDGTLYGTTVYDGAWALGTVFVMTPDGVSGYTTTTLHEFSGPDGATPLAPLIMASDGLLYGTTSAGGDNASGTVFRIDALGNFELLHSFSGGDGKSPDCRLFEASDGFLYGTTPSGGTHGAGTAFRMALDGSLTSLQSFTNTQGRPAGGVVQASDGLFYGPALGGDILRGTVYRMTASGAVTVLHEFSGVDGRNPLGPLVLASGGKMYGAAGGGATGGGAVYSIDTAGSFTLLHSLTASEGAFPSGPLFQGTDGWLYGVASGGGDEDRGTIYRFSTAGVFERLFAFTDAGPNQPAGALAEAAPGELLGATAVVHHAGFGVVYQFDLPSTLTVLHDFGAAEGAVPSASLTQGTDGLLYGVTNAGGPVGLGTIFRLSLDGSTFEHLHGFSGTDGAYPEGWLLRTSDGRFYGTTNFGPTDYFGTFFSLELPVSFTPLHDFSGESIEAPLNLIEASDGGFWGGSSSGIVRVDTSGVPQLVVPGSYLDDIRGLAEAPDGKLYGAISVANGRSFLFRMDFAGGYEELHTFTAAEGTVVTGPLMLGTDGNLYGVTESDGPHGHGGVFRYEPSSGNLSTIYGFGGYPVADGSFSSGKLAEAPDGFLYGTSGYSGLFSAGTVYRLSPAGDESIVHSFTGGDDGGWPSTGLTLGSDGALYGTTSSRGEFGAGVVFRIDPAALPGITSVSPGSGPASGGTAATIFGGGFADGAAVFVGPGAVTTPVVADAGTITITTPALDPGVLFPVYVINPDGGGASRSSGWLADFLDVPRDDPFHDAVESLVRSRVTAGCGGGYYCGGSNVTRAQMAVLLLKANDGPGYTPPPATGTTFSDVPASAFAADFIEELARRGVTAGCGGGNFCPSSGVTRAQMAPFLLKTLLGSNYVPPAATGLFDDVPIGSFAADYVEDLRARGVTAGCSASPPLYCPSASNTRAQMAAFLVLTFGL